jgi:hypothetical protein
MRVPTVVIILAVALAHAACIGIVSNTTEADPMQLVTQPTVMPTGRVPSSVAPEPDVADLPLLPDHRPVSQVDAAEDTWQTLERRPLRLPAVATGETCPVSVTSNAQGAPVLGFGPIYPRFGPFADGDGIIRLQRLGMPDGDGWSWMKVPWLSNADYRGPALIRGR